MDAALASLMDDLKEAIGYHVAGLYGGQLDADAFQAGMAQDLLVFHTSAYMAGLDTDELDAAGRRVVIDAVQKQLAYLDPFADAIDAGDLSPEEIEARALSYAGSINATWWAGA